MLTAHDGDEVLLESIQAGACGYLLKGSSSAQVLAAVRDVLGREVIEVWHKAEVPEDVDCIAITGGF